MSAPFILVLMTTCFLFFGYLGVPVPFALMGGVFIGAILSDVALAAIIQKFASGPVGGAAVAAVGVLRRDAPGNEIWFSGPSSA